MSAAPQANSTRTSIPLFDMRRQHDALRAELLAAIEQVCDSTRFIMGPECKQLEESIARYTGARHAIGCASGSDALLLALMAYDIGPGDEVLLPSYTFFATASAVARLGATPVFVDIEPVTFNIDVDDLSRKLSRRTKAIVPVHLYGQCADMAPITAMGARNAVPVVEDAAQAIGARYHGRHAGTMGDIGCFSFYPTKNLGGAGDGGMLTANDDNVAARLRLLRAHGMEPRYYHHVIGINSRLDSLQAAVLNVKLAHLDRWADQRRANAARYAAMFAERGLDKTLTLPRQAAGCDHVWNQYIVRVPDGRRDALRAHLDAQKIGTEIYYPLPLHQQPCFAYLGYSLGSLPETERAARETLALPIFPELRPDEQATVVAEIASFFGASKSTSVVPRPKFMGQRATSSRPAA